jgi:signal peptide peptidase SppA
MARHQSLSTGGLWLLHPRYGQQILDGNRRLAEAQQQPNPEAFWWAMEPPEVQTELTSDGTMIIPIHGPLTKAGSVWYDAPSTVQITEAVQQATSDSAVRQILLHIDSPGGQVAGIAELARAVRQANAVKPVLAHIDDLGASAAYWVASQARRITANSPAEVGALGAMIALLDMSGAFDARGLKMHVIATGPYKGVGVPGTSPDSEALAYLQEIVDDTAALFFDAVQTGRGLTDAQLEAATSGKVWLAAKAQGMGLIDAVQPYEQALREVATLGQGATSMSKRKLAQDLLRALGIRAKVDAQEDEDEEDEEMDPKMQEEEEEEEDEEKEDAKAAQALARKFAEGYVAAEHVVGLCTIAEMPELALQFLKKALQPDEARAALQDIRVKKQAQQEIVSQHLPTGQTPPAHRGIDTAGIYARRAEFSRTGQWKKD